MVLQKLFKRELKIVNNMILFEDSSEHLNQKQTNEIFSDKWKKVDDDDELDRVQDFQKNWYLDLYGFKNIFELKKFIESQEIILDAGCGLGYKAAWFASLSPKSTVIGMDFSDSVNIAAKKFNHIPNLYFIKGDIARTELRPGVIDYVSCDQVIHHTEKPEETFAHLTDITKLNGEFACYVYAKKALPRELLDSHFREYCKSLTNKDLWDMSESLTTLGKTLADLKINIDVPDIPQMGIKGGNYDLQRFLYWNFFKCFWNEDHGFNNSVSTNYDWYAPSNAVRYSEEEYKEIISRNKLEVLYFHSEEACYSGRFKKVQ